MSAEHRISITKGKLRLADEPAKGHNRWHEDIPPILTVEEGDTVVLDTRDGFDGQVTRDLAPDEFGKVSFLPNHAMTGPIHVRGAEPGDALEVEILDVEPDPFESYGFTAVVPDFGLLADQFTDVFIAHWDLHDREYAESPQIPGVRIPGRSFAGLIGVAPDRDLRERVRRREADLARSGAVVMEPDPREATPADERIAHEGLRTIPPRENGGNLDIKQFVPGSRVYLPVYTAGALVSLGDAHYAQGDGETCGTAIEMRARMHLRFHVRRRLARERVLPWPVFATAPTPPRESRCLGVVGLCVENDLNYSQDLTVAARQAVSSMIGLLGRAGYSPEQAYVIASVAADLHVGQVVDVPNVSVTALLPLDIFDDGGARVMNVLRGEDQVSV